MAFVFFRKSHNIFNIMLLIVLHKIGFTSTNLSLSNWLFHTFSWNRKQMPWQTYDFLTSNKCAICRCSEPKILQAAHIIAVSEGGNDGPENGICLCANHHLMYDNELIKIDFENLTLSDVAPTVKSMPWYDSFVKDYDSKIAERKAWIILREALNESLLKSICLSCLYIFRQLAKKNLRNASKKIFRIKFGISINIIILEKIWFWCYFDDVADGNLGIINNRWIFWCLKWASKAENQTVLRT